jgi:hypothetical protein
MPALKLIDQSLVAPKIDLTAITAIRLSQGRWEFKEFPVLALISKRLSPTVALPNSEDVIEYGYLVMDGASAPVELATVSDSALAVKVVKSSVLPLTDFLKQQLIDSVAPHSRPLSGIAVAPTAAAGTEILQNPSRATLPPPRRA